MVDVVAGTKGNTGLTAVRKAVCRAAAARSPDVTARQS